jgi:hypothetical protein
MGKYLSDTFLIQNGLKQRDSFIATFFYFYFEYVNRKVQETEVGMTLNGEHQFLNLLGDQVDTIKH